MVSFTRIRWPLFGRFRPHAIYTRIYIISVEASYYVTIPHKILPNLLGLTLLVRNPAQSHVGQPLAPVLDARHHGLQDLADLAHGRFLLLDGQSLDHRSPKELHPTGQAPVFGRRELRGPVFNLRLLNGEAGFLQGARHVRFGREEPAVDGLGAVHGDAMVHEGIQNGREDLVDVAMAAHLKDKGAAGSQSGEDAT